MTHFASVFRAPRVVCRIFGRAGETLHMTLQTTCATGMTGGSSWYAAYRFGWDRCRLSRSGGRNRWLGGWSCRCGDSRCLVAGQTVVVRKTIILMKLWNWRNTGSFAIVTAETARTTGSIVRNRHGTARGGCCWLGTRSCCGCDGWFVASQTNIIAAPSMICRGRVDLSLEPVTDLAIWISANGMRNGGGWSAWVACRCNRRLEQLG